MTRLSVILFISLIGLCVAIPSDSDQQDLTEWALPQWPRYKARERRQQAKLEYLGQKIRIFNDAQSKRLFPPWDWSISLPIGLGSNKKRKGPYKRDIIYVLILFRKD